MIKLQNLIKEELANTPINGEKIMSLLGSKYSVSHEFATEEKVRLYRGCYLTNTEVYPTKNERVSRDFNNLYTVLLSNLPSWKGWPRRSFCLIFTNDKTAIAGGKNESFVFPENGSKIVAAAKQDVILYEASPFLYENFGTALHIHGNVFWLTLSRMTIPVEGFFFKTIKYKDYQTFINFINEKLTPEILWEYQKGGYLKDLAGEQMINLFIEEREKFNGNWESFLSYYMDPIKNKFQLVDIKNIGDIKHDSEMWTENDCLMTDIY